MSLFAVNKVISKSRLLHNVTSCLPSTFVDSFADTRATKVLRAEAGQQKPACYVKISKISSHSAADTGHTLRVWCLPNLAESFSQPDHERDPAVSTFPNHLTSSPFTKAYSGAHKGPKTLFQLQSFRFHNHEYLSSERTSDAAARTSIGGEHHSFRYGVTVGESQRHYRSRYDHRG